MQKLTEFISKHISDDTTKLLLARKKWPDIDIDLAVNCIESRRKLKGKVQEWYDRQDLIFPAKLSAEQCSSSATAQYKTDLAERIALHCDIPHDGRGNTDKEEWTIGDLTGGLGVDSWYFSKKASRVLYNEMQIPLCDAARYNFAALGARNIEIRNHAVGMDGITPEEVLSSFKADIIYMDPARRGEGGKKVFLIEECTPDVISLKDGIFSICRHIMIKLSPMADISMVCSRLGKTCREVHVVATGGECKELLIWMDREWDKEYSVHAVELPENYPESMAYEFRFLPSEEKETEAVSCRIKENDYLFEPGKSIMKAGAFNLTGNRLGLSKLGKSTHYYIFHDEGKVNELKKAGKVYHILRCSPLDKRTMKAAGKDYPKSEVTARNIPMDTDTLRKKMGITSGDDAHIFGLKSDTEGNLLLCTKRML